MKSTVNIEQEVGIALLLYGGYRIAVYMNGMARAEFRNVRLITSNRLL